MSQRILQGTRRNNSLRGHTFSPLLTLLTQPVSWKNKSRTIKQEETNRGSAFCYLRQLDCQTLKSVKPKTHLNKQWSQVTQVYSCIKYVSWKRVKGSSDNILVQISLVWQFNSAVPDVSAEIQLQEEPDHALRNYAAPFYSLSTSIHIYSHLFCINHLVSFTVVVFRKTIRSSVQIRWANKTLCCNKAISECIRWCTTEQRRTNRPFAKLGPLGYCCYACPAFAPILSNLKRKYTQQKKKKKQNTHTNKMRD